MCHRFEMQQFLGMQQGMLLFFSFMSAFSACVNSLAHILQYEVWFCT